MMREKNTESDLHRKNDNRSIKKERVKNMSIFCSTGEYMKFKIISFCLLIFTIIFSTSTALGEEKKPSGTLSLKESLSIAEKNNPALLIEQSKVKSALVRIDGAQAEFYPKLKAETSYTKLNEAPSIPLSSGTIPLGWDETYSYSVGFEQPVFTGHALSTNYDKAKLGYEIALSGYENTKDEIYLATISGYFSILRAQRHKEVSQQAVVELQENLRVVSEMFDAGVVAKNDLLRAEVQLAEGKQNLIKAHNQVILAKSSFANILRTPKDVDIDIEDIRQYTPYQISLDISYEKAKASRSDLKALELQIKASEAGIKLAKSDYYPKIAITGSYGYKDDKLGSLKNENWNVVGVLKWLIWDWGSTKSKVQEAQSVSQQLYDTKIQLVDRIELEIKDAYYGLIEAIERIKVSEGAVIQAEENYRVSQVRYREGVTTNSEVLDAQTLLTRARMNYYNALYDHWVARAKMDKATGNIQNWK